jgi:DNA-binding CsgD family transcriptional regulator
MICDLRSLLSEREQEVYELLVQSMTNQQIASRLDLSESGVRYFLRSIYKKLGVESNAASDKQCARRRAISYAGTRVLDGSGDKYSLEQIKLSAAKIGLDHASIETLVGFLQI